MKRQSIVVSILIISVLIISLGLIVTVQEFTKSYNEKNFVETEQVLLDFQQDSYGALSGLSFLDNEDEDDDNDIFESLSFDSSGGGGGGGGSSSSKKSKKDDSSDVVNEEVDLNESDLNESGVNESENESNFSGEGLEINFSANSGAINNETNLNNTGINETNNETENEINSSSEGFGPPKSLEGIEVKSIIDSSIIWFSQAPPSNICYNFDEVTDTISLGLGTVSLSLGWGDYTKCQVGLLYSGSWDISVDYCLIEDDPLYDDVIKCNYGTATTYNCATLDLENYHGYTVKRKFTNVRLSSQFNELWEGDRIELYAEVSNYNNYFDSYKTSSSYVYKKTCECISGVCCDLSRNEFKDYPSQPTGYTDYYYCYGSNSATGTNYVKKRDYYCSGSSSSAYSRTFTVDTCGTCEYCQSGYSYCRNYGTSTSCGTRDCDYLDTSCRDYHDVNKYCNGMGSCSIYGSCNDYTNRPKGILCGANSECDGYGTCEYCTSHDYLGCYNDDVYWYDKCDDREGLVDNCGDDYEGTNWDFYCEGNDVRKDKQCIERWCSSAECQASSWYSCYDTYVETCDYECQDGYCKPDPNIECTWDGDCPTIESNPYCQTSGSSSYVEKSYTNYKCVNSNCEYDGTGYGIVEDCGEVEYSDNYCDGNDVYRDFTDKCSNGICSEQPPVKQIVQECGIEVCENGQCKCTDECSSGQTRCDGYYYKQSCGNYDADVCLEWGGNEYCSYGCESGECKPEEIICSSNSDCGTSGYTGYVSCQNNDVWQNYIKYTCNNPGKSSSYCWHSIIYKLKEDCLGGCTAGRCKIKVCEEICNAGRCYGPYCGWE